MADGVVLVDGHPADKPARAVDTHSRIELSRRPDAWVGRAAYKLVHALDTWPAVDPRGARCLDVGASTGGFTQVLLQRGAAQVVALDVGHDQLVADLRADPRVVDRPGFSIRDVSGPAAIGGEVDLVAVDLSFISVTLVAGVLARVLRPGGDLVVLVKPQFEVGKERLGKKGVVLDPHARRDALRSVAAAVTAAGLVPQEVTTSPITGTQGNVEYLLWAVSPPSGKMDGSAHDPPSSQPVAAALDERIVAITRGGLSP